MPLELFLRLDLARSLFQLYRPDCERENDYVEDDADGYPKPARREAERGTLKETIEIRRRIRMQIDLQRPAEGEQDEDP